MIDLIYGFEFQFVLGSVSVLNQLVCLALEGDVLAFVDGPRSQSIALGAAYFGRFTVRNFYLTVWHRVPVAEIRLHPFNDAFDSDLCFHGALVL
jgi:hypothetical protein